MTWHLAHNLAVRVAAVKGCYPALAIGEIGDQAHQSEASDHNPDSRGIVHAVDFMAAAGTAEAKAILGWLLADPADLQYVIHNREIYTRAADFKPAPYHGSDPHTNHIHVSGKHGTTGRNAATGTGYDTAAEAMTPAGTPCNPTLEDDDMDPKTVWEGTAVDIIKPTADVVTAGNPTWQPGGTLEWLVNHVHAIETTLAKENAPALAAALAPLLPKGVTVTPAALQAAVLGALKELAVPATPAS